MPQRGCHAKIDKSRTRHVRLFDFRELYKSIGEDGCDFPRRLLGRTCQSERGIGGHFPTPLTTRRLHGNGTQIESSRKLAGVAEILDRFQHQRANLGKCVHDESRYLRLMPPRPLTRYSQRCSSSLTGKSGCGTRKPLYIPR